MSSKARSPHPIVMEIHAEAQRLGLTATDHARRGGLEKCLWNKWRSGAVSGPRITGLEAMADAVGLEIVLRKKR